MNQLPILKKASNSDLAINLCQLNHLKFDKDKEGYIVTLVDNAGYESLKGYGNTPIDAINDLHHNLI